MTYLEKARARLQGSRLAQDEAGLSTVEYVIILVLVAAIAIGTWQTFGQTVQSGLTGATEKFNDGVVDKVDDKGGAAPKMGGGQAIGRK